jgi:hypothetical protein
MQQMTSPPFFLAFFLGGPKHILRKQREKVVLLLGVTIGDDFL